MSVINAFRRRETSLSSENHGLHSLEVLKLLSSDLISNGFECAVTPTARKKSVVSLPADDPAGSRVTKFDAFHRASKTSVNVLAGQGVANNTYLRSALHASLAVDVRHVVIAVRLTYNNSSNFDPAKEFLDVLMNSENTRLDLDSLTLIGY